MTPGQKFTKTWMVQNTGGCAWQPGFKWTLVGGNPMGGSTVTLTQAVNPGDQYQISVPLVAPATAGESNGTWKMADANGTFFGEAPWVKVVVTNANHCNNQYAEQNTYCHTLIHLRKRSSMEARHEKKKHPGRHRLDCACADYGDRFTRLHSNDTKFGYEFQRRSNCGSGNLRIQPDPNRGRASDVHSNSDAHYHAHIINIILTANATPTPACYHLRWIKDVTVKDFTPMNARRNIHKNVAGIEQRDLCMEAGFSIRFLWRRPDGRLELHAGTACQSRRSN